MTFRRRMTGSTLLTICLLLLTAYSPGVFNCKEILQKTIRTVETIQTLKFHLKCIERINGNLVSSESQVKLNRSPRKIYIYLKGPELLWVEGKNNNNALINPHGFPYMNLNLDPMGSLLRGKQHHTIHQIGFAYFTDIINHSISVLGDRFNDYFQCTGSISWDSHECFFITAEYPDFKYEDYIVQKGETIVSIAQKLKVSDYMILKINSDKVTNYHDVIANEHIKVPNVYGKKIIMYIDEKLFIPRLIKVYDDKGLFESYEYHDLQVNAPIAPEEFTKNYKGYGF